MLTKLRRGAVCLLSAKTVDEQIMVKLLRTIIKGEPKERDCKTKRFKFHVIGPNPKVSHLVFPPELGSEDHYATPRR